MDIHGDGSVRLTYEEWKYYRKRDAQLEFALDVIPNLDDVLEQMEYDEDDQ
jgi:hypothetical protein